MAPAVSPCEKRSCRNTLNTKRHVAGNTKGADMTHLSHHRLLSGRGRLAAWLVLATGIALSIAAWFLTHALVERDARHKFESATIVIAVTAQTSIRGYADLLYGLQGLFQAGPAVSRAAFDRYVYSLNLPLHYPGVRSVSYVRRVPAATKAEFERQLRRDPGLIRRGRCHRWREGGRDNHDHRRDKVPCQEID